MITDYLSPGKISIAAHRLAPVLDWIHLAVVLVIEVSKRCSKVDPFYTYSEHRQVDQSRYLD